MPLIKSILNKIIGSKTKLTLKELIRNTPRERVVKATTEVGTPVYLGFTHEIHKENLFNKLNAWVRSFVSKILGTKDTLVVYIVLHFRVKGSTGNHYDVKIKFPYRRNMDKENLFNIPVRVYCSCADFKFRSAYVLNRTGNIYTNPKVERELGLALTKAPKITNPDQLEFVCKHTIKVVSKLNTNIRDYLKLKYNGQ